MGKVEAVVEAMAGRLGTCQSAVEAINGGEWLARWQGLAEVAMVATGWQRLATAGKAGNGWL